MIYKKQLLKIFSIFLLISIILTSLSACGKTTGKVFNNQRSEDASKYYEADGIAVLANSRYRLELDSETTHFVISDLSNNLTYKSVPDFECNVISDVVEKKFISEIVLNYYDSNSKSYSMYSTADSVENSGHKVTQNDTTIRVTYNFGEESQTIFAPVVLTVDDYNAISKKLTSSQNRRLKLYYTLYSQKEPTDDFEAMSEKYPIIKKKDLYIIKDSLSELNKMDIDGYMKTAGYTSIKYEKLLKELEIKVDKADVPGFTVPVEYSLNEDGFSATVLYDLISESSENYKLQSVELLPFFAATDSSAKGEFLVPDGSGALIYMNSSNPASYVSRFYGDDIPITYEDKQIFRQNQYLPIWGVTHENGVYFAIVESASANAELSVETMGASSPANVSYARFDYRTKDEEINVNMATSGSTEGVYNLYSDPLLSEFPSVRYCLLKPNSNYVQMADYYREYLISNKYLEKSDNTTDVLLDFICVASNKTNILGIPFEKKVVLTTISDVKNTLNKLYKEGVSDVSVRLIGFDNSGLKHGISDNYSLYKKVGSQKELNELSALLKKNGGTLYLDADFQTVYSNSAFDSFSERSDVAYTLGKKLVGVGNYNIINGELKQEGLGYFLSPAIYKSTTSSFLDTISKLDNTGVAYINAGKLLGGNYSDSNFVSRDMAIKSLKEAVSVSNNSVLIGGGNIYALNNADFVTDVSFDSSKYDFENMSVPFWQLVMHGELNYSGVTYNNSYNREMLMLKTIETGAALHFVFVGKNDDILLSENLYNTLSSVSIEGRIDQVVSLYNEIKDFRNTVKNKRIRDHTLVLPNVYKTVYQNGAYSIVNYNLEDIVVEDINISGNGFYVKGAE